MRVLTCDHAAARVSPGDELTSDDLDALYAAAGPLLRLNFVTTLDGAATGPDGRSGTINSAADHRGFTAMRRAADVLLVGAGTVRAEEYGPARLPVVVVSGHPELPDSVRGQEGVVLATTAASGATASESVWICGQDGVDLPRLLGRVRREIGPHVLSEGGPTLAAELVALGLVDELALSWTPNLVGGARGDHPRLLDGADVDVDLTCRHLLEEDGTLLGLWCPVR
ncbi:dihydrofolate reductase family protein [Janibacter cremeus]|uniref:dihydrofolate reductase family protein n=1 Tax=Janibacter cremeus TaxID=1285192 RepID=UPI0023F9BA2B|nr:dihydrofolate reductase family protein [Janibacter cremeus]WEV78999.1 dihydrofolate reductase family protein [Janibacter cremeus]